MEPMKMAESDSSGDIADSEMNPSHLIVKKDAGVAGKSIATISIDPKKVVSWIGEFCFKKGSST